MPKASYAQYSFLGGEISPHAQGRMDDPEYKISLAVSHNGLPVEEGAWTRRPGFQFSATTRNGVAGRLIPFLLPETTSYNLEFTDGHMRAHAGTDLVTDNAASLVASISTAKPAVLTLSADAAWVDDDQIEFTYVDEASKIAVPYLAHRVMSVIGSGSSFTLFDPISGLPIDGAKVAWLDANVQATKVFDITTSYTGTRWQSLRIVQTDDKAALLNKAVRPQNLSATVNSQGFYSFKLDPISFADGPYLDPVPGSILTPNQTSGTITLSLSAQAYSATKAYVKGEFVQDSNDIVYRSLIDQNINNTPATSTTAWELSFPGAAVGPNGFQDSDIGRSIRVFGSDNNWQWGRITALSTSGVISITDSTEYRYGFAGNIGAAWDGIFSKPHTTVAYSFGQLAPGQVITYSNGLGRNFDVAQSVVSAVYYPSNDIGFLNTGGSVSGLTLSLRGSNSAPSSALDGTILATQVLPDLRSTQAVTLLSNDTTTTWQYIWFSISATMFGGDDTFYAFYCAQIQFFNDAGAIGSAVDVVMLGALDYPSYLATTTYGLGAEVTYNGVAYVSIATANTGNTPPSSATKWKVADPIPDTSPINKWRLGLYSDTSGWPTCGCYQGGRLWLSGAVPNRIDASNSNDPYNFSPTAASGVVGDSNAITGVFNSTKKNTIFWMKPDLQGIVCGTQEGEWLIQSGSANVGLTPANAKADLVTTYGAANIEPIIPGLATMFVQKVGRKVQEYLSDIYSGRFFSPNATADAGHLTVGGVKELAWQSGVQNVAWARTGAGALIGCTYNRVTQSSAAKPEYEGWHQHTLGSGHKVVSICTGPSVDGLLTSLAVVTANSDGVHHVEVMRNFFGEEDLITSAWFCDDAIVPLAGATSTVAFKTGIKFYGLWHLEGQQVDAFIGALDCGTFLVADGAIFVPYQSDSGKRFTQPYLAGLTTNGLDYGDMKCSIDGGMLTIPAVVGYSYQSKGRLLRPNAPAVVGAASGPGFGKLRRNHKFAALLHNTRGISFGVDDGKQYPAKLTNPAGTAISTDQLFSGMVKDTIEDTDTMNGQLTWVIDRPFPATIATIGGFIQTQDE